MIVKIKKLVDNAVLPTYAHDGDACMDLTAISKKFVDEVNYGYIEYDFGLSFEFPDDHVMLIFPRGSISETGLMLSNAVGVVEPTYRGSIKVRFKWIKGSAQYEVGDRIAQFMIIPRPKIELELVDELSETARGSGGYGSTNKQSKKGQ